MTDEEKAITKSTMEMLGLQQRAIGERDEARREVERLRALVDSPATPEAREVPPKVSAWEKAADWCDEEAEKAIGAYQDNPDSEDVARFEGQEYAYRQASDHLRTVAGMNGWPSPSSASGGADDLLDEQAGVVRALQESLATRDAEIGRLRDALTNADTLTAFHRDINTADGATIARLRADLAQLEVLNADLAERLASETTTLDGHVALVRETISILSGKPWDYTNRDGLVDLAKEAVALNAAKDAEVEKLTEQLRITRASRDWLQAETLRHEDTIRSDSALREAAVAGERAGFVARLRGRIQKLRAHQHEFATPGLLLDGLVWEVNVLADAADVRSPSPTSAEQPRAKRCGDKFVDHLGGGQTYFCHRERDHDGEHEGLGQTVEWAAVDAQPPAPSKPDILKSLSDEEYAKIEPLSPETIERTLEEGRAAVRAVRSNNKPPAPVCERCGGTKTVWGRDWEGTNMCPSMPCPECTGRAKTSAESSGRQECRQPKEVTHAPGEVVPEKVASKPAVTRDRVQHPAEANPLADRAVKSAVSTPEAGEVRVERSVGGTKHIVLFGGGYIDDYDDEDIAADVAANLRKSLRPLLADARREGILVAAGECKAQADGLAERSREERLSSHDTGSLRAYREMQEHLEALAAGAKS